MGRQEEQPCASGLYGLLGGRALVGGEVVENDNIALCQRRASCISTHHLARSNDQGRSKSSAGRPEIYNA